MLLAHAILATVAFGFFFPLGGILIRVGSGPRLWLVHAMIQVCATLMYIAALVLGIFLCVSPASEIWYISLTANNPLECFRTRSIQPLPPHHWIRPDGTAYLPATVWHAPSQHVQATQPPSLLLILSHLAWKNPHHIGDCEWWSGLDVRHGVPAPPSTSSSYHRVQRRSRCDVAFLHPLHHCWRRTKRKSIRELGFL